MAFKIITDSATDLPKEIVEKYKLHVIPTPVTIDGTDYFDGKTIFPEDFYRIQAQGTDIKTYHINQYMFRENFEPYAKAGDEVLYMCFSTGIAGTFNAANLAKEELLEEYPEFDLTIIDTKCASLGFGLAVEKILSLSSVRMHSSAFSGWITQPSKVHTVSSTCWRSSEVTWAAPGPISVQAPCWSRASRICVTACRLCRRISRYWKLCAGTTPVYTRWIL